MATYHTEGTIKVIEFVGNQPVIKVDPTAPYRFAEKNGGTENVQILFVENTTAFLVDPAMSFSIKNDLETQVNFSALLILKQNRTKIRIEVSYDSSSPAPPKQIENISICE